MKTTWIKIAILLLSSSCLLQCTANPLGKNDDSEDPNKSTTETDPSTLETTTNSEPVTASSESPTTETSTSTDQSTPTGQSTISTGGTSPSSPEPPTTTPCPDCPDPGRKFDGLSFFGGILLSFGMMALAYVAYWFYKKRAAKNYHAM